MPLAVIILAAGQGSRMCSSLPKVLHPLAGKSLLEHTVSAALQLHPQHIHIVYGYGGDTVPTRLKHLPVNWAEQIQQLGTGHAVAQAMPLVDDAATVLVLYGDVPLICAATLETLLLAADADRFGLLTVKLADPTGYGRIVRDSDGMVLRIVEHKDATEQEREINEINTGILACNAGRLRGWLSKLENNNAQGEFYLTDIIAAAVRDGLTVNAVHPGSEMEVLGVNNKAQLAQLERHYQLQQAHALMLQGVTLHDPARFDLRGTLNVGSDVVIDINAVLEGTISLGNRVSIGPNVCVRNAKIGDDVEILANCVIEDAVIGAGCRIGPFARIRPETELAAGVNIGNFVEVKKSRIGVGSKINHLSYIGDTTVGSQVNIGAGTITCNYDGANKHRTVIGDEVFIGSATQLVAPVTIGAGATIGAGSTITRDAPAGQLTLTRSPQKSVEGWVRPVKIKR